MKTAENMKSWPFPWKAYWRPILICCTRRVYGLHLLPHHILHTKEILNLKLQSPIRHDCLATAQWSNLNRLIVTKNTILREVSIPERLAKWSPLSLPNAINLGGDETPPDLPHIISHSAAQKQLIKVAN